MIVVVGGTPGSGKSTVVSILAEKHGLTVVSSGVMFREEAVRRGMTLEEFGAYAQKHHEVDQELDAQVTKVVLGKGQSEDLLVDSRLQAYILQREGAKSFAVQIDAPLRVRAERVASREAKSVAQAMREVRERERSERTRYLSIYGIDIGDLSVYDLIVDSGDKTAEQVAELIWSQVQK